MIKPRKRLLIWGGIGMTIVVSALAAAAIVIARRAGPILKARITETLRASFHGRVDLQTVDIAAWHGFEVSGDGLRIYATNDSGTPPLVSVSHFSFHAPFFGLLFKPTHVSEVKIDGLVIDIPPGQLRSQTSSLTGKKSHDKIEVLVDEIVCDNSRLTVDNANPGKGPKVFELRHIELHNVGPAAPWRYQAQLINAIPRGEIEAAGDFGPWQSDNPAETAVTGHYVFKHADLGTIRGIGGNLSSTGDFTGKLNRIVVDGTTETPDFSLDTANRPIPLHTRFHAIVDGITGDTYLQPVQATLRNSSFTADGAVIDIKGRGHAIDLNVDVPAGRLQDFLDLVVATRPAVLTAAISTKAKLHIRAGKERVVQKLSIAGRFRLWGMHFTNPRVQDKVDMLSERARGHPENARPGATDVNAGMTGDFSLEQGSIEFRSLIYTLPGAQVRLAGAYSLDGQVFNFRGHVLTNVPLYKMVQSRLASVALHAVSPLFRNARGGADIPVTISGTRSAPKFGLDLAHR
ncbi:MAG: hypothetical protein ACLP59_27540 [Bryobacteraceae bacterium]